MKSETSLARYIARAFKAWLAMVQEVLDAQ